MDENNIYHARTSPPHPPCMRERTTGLVGKRVCDEESTPNYSKPEYRKTRMKNQFAITLKDERNDPAQPPVEIRLRRFLKAALRSYGLRCTSIGPATIEVRNKNDNNQNDAPKSSGNT